VWSSITMMIVDCGSIHRHAPCITMQSPGVVQLQKYRREVANLIEIVTTVARLLYKGVGEVNGKSTSRSGTKDDAKQ